MSEMKKIRNKWQHIVDHLTEVERLWKETGWGDGESDIRNLKAIAGTRLIKANADWKADEGKSIMESIKEASGG